MRLLNLPDTETPNNEMIRPASAHVAMSTYLLYMLRKGGTLGQQRRTEVKHTHNYSYYCTTHIIRHAIISNRLANSLVPMHQATKAGRGGLGTRLIVIVYHQLCLPSDLPVCSTPPGERHTVIIIEGREEGRDRHKSHVHVHNNKHSQQRRW